MTPIPLSETTIPVTLVEPRVEPVKTCSKCSVSKPEAGFRKGKSTCRACKNERQRAYQRELTQRPDIVSPEHKTCSRCKREKPGSAFYTKRGILDGLQSCCKDCWDATIRTRNARLAQRASIEVPSEKKCSTCKRMQLAAAFSPDRRKLGGLQSQCRDCRTVGQKAHHASNAARTHIVSPSEKKCTSCKLVLPAASFAKNPCQKSGLSGECRKCGYKRASVYVQGPGKAKHRADAKRRAQTPSGRVAIRLKSHRRRARLLDGCSPGVTQKQWRAIVELFAGRCAYCLRKADTIDHIHSIAAGGLDAPENVVPACLSCNSSKADLTVLQLLMRPTRLVTSRMFAKVPVEILEC